MADNTVERSETAGQSSGSVTLARIVSWLTSALLLLLALRVLLSLLGANQGNPIASFIYGLSYPFVAPFFGLLGYTMQYGVSRLEIETLVAMAVYGVLGYLVTRLFASRRAVDRI